MLQKLTRIPVEFLHMGWAIYWGLAFGFILSALIRAFISTETISTKLGKNTIAAVGLSSFFGAISSSCSYAAASMARTLLIKGSTWSNAVVFMVASTNLVFEIFIVIVTLLGWPFFAGEVIGGIIFILLSALLIAWVYPPKVKAEAKEHVSHEHDHDMAMPAAKGLKAKLNAASGYFYMDVMMVGKDILVGVAIASVLMVLVPDSFWKSIFLTNSNHLPHLFILAWNALAGILIAIFAFVCSVGNIVMAAVLWHGGISFGGVIAFILSDLVTIPMLLVFRSYYGLKTMWFLLVTLTFCIFLTALMVDYSFATLHWLPKLQTVGMQAMNNSFQWDWQAWLNLIFIPSSVVFFFLGKLSTKHST